VPRIAKVEPITTARALRGPFDYLRPAGVDVGSLLVVPFGRRDVLGVVVDVAEESEVADERLVEPREVLDADLPVDLVELATWLAAEYCSTPARALALVSPPAHTRARLAWWVSATGDGEPPEGRPLTTAQRELLAAVREHGPKPAGADLAALRRLERRGLVRLERRAVRRAPEHVRVGARRAEPPPLTPDQAAALGEIERAVVQREPARLLLHGVTGSGKTEVYLRAAEAALRRGAGAIVLVPEIALTPQIVGRFADRFGDTVAVLHSRLSAGERRDEWHRLRAGEARVCVGPRSAVFAPIANLGLVVVDEEHDASYKHEGDPRYDARRVAAWRAAHAGAVLLLGSATPRPESVHVLKRLRLPRRVDDRPLPPVEIVDMRQTSGALHPTTVHALADAPKAIVLLNRRGWSNFVDCRTCGRVWSCPHCDVSLVLHRASGLLACHHCGHRERMPRACGACGSVTVARHGTGTERLEHDLRGLGHEVLRLDADVRDAPAVLRAFERAERAILVGTQMVAKGHDFADVALGVVVDADATLRFPDFRAEERTFALVAQLAGRAGRGGERAARVLVQTLDPQAAPIAAAARHDADGFLAGELARREALSYPPFASLVRIVCSAPEVERATGAARAIAGRIRGLDGLRVLGPAPLFRLRDRERAQLLLKTTQRRATVRAVGAAVDAVAAEKAHRGVALSVDVDPQ
jgi:primosomal protein N' (replication factor Y) (superfamily II helicase)